MPEILKRMDTTPDPPDGWEIRYIVRREDGLLVEVRAACSRATEATIREHATDPVTRAALEDQCAMVAVKRSGELEPWGDKERSAFLEIWFDPKKGVLKSSLAPPH